MKTTAETFYIIEKLLDRYLKEIEDSGAKPLTKKVYIKNTQNFVRWIAGDFTPGGSARVARRLLAIK